MLRSGAVKTYILDRSGAEQITGFFSPGDWVGLEAFGRRTYPSAAIALADTTLCAIPFRRDRQAMRERAGPAPTLMAQPLAGHGR